MAFEDRADALLQELDGKSWDLIVITETWREQEREQFVTKCGHTWFGAGGRPRERGVGFFLHERWTHLASSPASV